MTTYLTRSNACLSIAAPTVHPGWLDMRSTCLNQTKSSCSFIVAAFLPLFVLIVSVTAASPQEYSLPVPEGVLPPLIPNDNPVTQAKVELGQKLYFDPRLSVDDTVSCATCHDPNKGFADGLKTSKGVGGKTGVRSAPTVLNAAYYEQQFWDGRAADLEEQAKGPMINPVEMAMPSHAAVEEKLRKIPEYPLLFQKAFGKPEINIDRVAKAIASFERTVISLSAPIDRFLAGDKNAIAESAKRGWALFNGKARCNTCHGHVGILPTFTDNKYHNIGVAMKDKNFAELARRVASRRRGRWDLSLVSAMVALLQDDKSLFGHLSPPIQFNLEARSGYVS